MGRRLTPRPCGKVPVPNLFTPSSQLDAFICQEIFGWKAEQPNDYKYWKVIKPEGGVVDTFQVQNPARDDGMTWWDGLDKQELLPQFSRGNIDAAMLFDKVVSDYFVNWAAFGSSCEVVLISRNTGQQYVGAAMTPAMAMVQAVLSANGFK